MLASHKSHNFLMYIPTYIYTQTWCYSTQEVLFWYGQCRLLQKNSKPLFAAETLQLSPYPPCTQAAATTQQRNPYFQLKTESPARTRPGSRQTAVPGHPSWTCARRQLPALSPSFQRCLYWWTWHKAAGHCGWRWHAHPPLPYEESPPSLHHSMTVTLYSDNYPATDFGTSCPTLTIFFGRMISLCCVTLAWHAMQLLLWLCRHWWRVQGKNA